MELERLRKGATYPAPVFLPPSSAAFSSLLVCSRIPAHLFHFPLSFIYLVIHVLMRNRAALSRRGLALLWWDVFGQLLLIERAPVDDWTLSHELCSFALYLVFKK